MIYLYNVYIPKCIENEKTDQDKSSKQRYLSAITSAKKFYWTWVVQIFQGEKFSIISSIDSNTRILRSLSQKNIIIYILPM